jgi:multiple RNA-binding domain-containing protein 1
MEQLKHSHLLGRHLVMDWAAKEQGAEEMRMKTAMQFGDGGGELGRKEKLKLGLGGQADGSDEE